MIKSIKNFLLKFSTVEKLALFKFKLKFKKRNKHNFVTPLNYFDLNKVEVGKYTYGNLSIKEFGLKEEKLIIGNFCSIAENVTFLLSGEHSYKRISTYPFKTKLLNYSEECFCKGPIVVKDDVWIGYGVTILSGVTIGQGAIIGAGSIVTKNIPPYAIYANGRIVKYRFNDSVIKKLLKLNYNNIDINYIKNNINKLYVELNEENIDDITGELKDE